MARRSSTSSIARICLVSAQATGLLSPRGAGCNRHLCRAWSEISRPSQHSTETLLDKTIVAQRIVGGPTISEIACSWPVCSTTTISSFPPPRSQRLIVTPFPRTNDTVAATLTSSSLAVNAIFGRSPGGPCVGRPHLQKQMNRVRVIFPWLGGTIIRAGGRSDRCRVKRKSGGLTRPNDADELIAYDGLHEGQQTVVDALVNLYHWFGRYGVVRYRV